MPAPPILVAGRANPRVKQLRAAFAGQARLSGGLVAIEGENLLREALVSGLPLKTVFLSQRIQPPAWLPRGVELMYLADELFSSVADTQSPQGIAALLVPPIWEMESALPANLPSGEAPLLLVAAGLQDPGNLGTLIRSAEAFGASAVLTTPGTVGQWNQKALRASAGSVFRIPVVQVSVQQLAALKLRGVRLFAAVAPDSGPDADAPFGSEAHSEVMRGGHAVLAVDAGLTLPCALIIGNEGAGLSAELLALADARIAIPTPGRVESLNAAVAGSLLLYEASRQRESSRQPGPARQRAALQPTTCHAPRTTAV